MGPTNTRRSFMKGAGGATVGITAGLAGCLFGGDDEDLVIQYNAVDGWANYSTVRDTFTDETGIDFPEDTKNSGQTLNALTNEADNPQADVAYMGISDAIVAEQEGLTEPYQPEHWDQIPDDLKHEDGEWFCNHYGTVGWAVNTEEIEDPPETWEDLLDERFEDTIALYNPESAYNGFINYVNANLAMGGSLTDFEPGIDFFQELQDRGNIAAMPDQGVTTSFFQGEVPMLMAYDFNAYEAKYLSDMDEDSVEVIVPDDSALVIPYTLNVVNDAPRRENAEALCDFQLSEQGQQLFAESFVTPARDDVSIPDDVAEMMLPDDEYGGSEAIDYEELVEHQGDIRSEFSEEIAS
ncbi:extracellular solute-binding protein [Natrarchaeobius halalkaliphilus]|uniref:Extracellular solute-binding protein n=1 Tax=Natrarchaeobius halalkaliphilus TaxID=1679091 RepID=A0A3N6LSQ4_9EURY|nr:substrate-binding domain-containing protein [Natrarchaeobius halalkaliphilus]RQG92998.1 extracellular solute-binding protein [Natrarchaeobius halalkaliphilus]